MDADSVAAKRKAREAIRKRVSVMAHNLPEQLSRNHPFVVDSITDFVMGELEGCMARILLAYSDTEGVA